MFGIEKFVSRTQKLLEKERAAEIEETRERTAHCSPKQLQQQGICLLKLEISECCTGLYGRTVLTFKTLGPVVNGELPAHKFSPGDIAGISLTNSSLQDDLLATGIVSRLSPTNIQIALDKSDETGSLDSSSNELYRLIKLANEITYKRLKRALDDLQHYSSGTVQRLINVLFGLSDLTPPLLPPQIQWINSNLDASQQEAVQFALAQPEVAVIHGPPGTGKTTTVVEIILQAVRQGLKVLALAPSNVAVDNLVERLSVHERRIVRIGHPARVLPHIQSFCLDAMITSSDQTKLLVDVRNDIQKTLRKLKGSSGKERAVIKDEIKDLRREVRQREEAAVLEVLSHSNVVLATLTSAGPDSPLKLLQKSYFQLVVIDECSQALEAACWIGLLHGPQCVLAGDIHQLPPTILSQDAAKEGLGVTLMERVIDMYGDRAVRMLTVQYRMHKDIMVWPSQQLYKGRLQAHDSVASHLLKDLSGVEDCPETATPLLLVDTAGCDLMELDVPAESSKGNEGEANVVIAHVQRLVKAGVPPGEIAVISPYNLQVDIIRQKLCMEFPKLEVKTVDGFQGREKEAVVISFVRSNEKKEVGFLAENRRINVAITRARRHLAVVCDSDTVSADPFLKSLVDYMTEAGEVWSAEGYLQGIVESKMQTYKSFHLATSKDDKDNKSKQEKRGKEQKQQSKQKAGQPKAEKADMTNDTAEGTEEKVTKFEHLLLGFQANPEQSSITFSSSLTSYERMIIHEISERLQLVHISSGEGKDRYVVVSKSSAIPRSLPQMVDSPSEQQKGTDEELLGKCKLVQGLSDDQGNAADKDTVSCIELVQGLSGEQANDSGDKDTINGIGSSADLLMECTNINLQQPSDFQEDSLMQEASRKIEKSGVSEKDKANKNTDLPKERARGSLQPPPASSDASHKGKKKTSKPKTKAPSQAQEAAKALSKIDNDDFDSLLAAAAAVDWKCKFSKCKTKTGTLGGNCRFCSCRFCLEHMMPELHGCGEAARIYARQNLRHEVNLCQGGRPPSRHVPPERTAQLQRKLNKKLDELAHQRKRTTKKDDTS